MFQGRKTAFFLFFLFLLQSSVLPEWWSPRRRGVNFQILFHSPSSASSCHQERDVPRTTRRKAGSWVSYRLPKAAAGTLGALCPFGSSRNQVAFSEEVVPKAAPTSTSPFPVAAGGVGITEAIIWETLWHTCTHRTPTWCSSRRDKNLPGLCENQLLCSSATFNGQAA